MTPGTVTLGVEVADISATDSGFLVGDEGLAVPFLQFPRFKKAAMEQLADVRRPTEGRLDRPQLDVDLSVESVRKPDALPRVSAGQP